MSSTRGMTFVSFFVICCCFLTGIESNPGIKMMISDSGLKYAANQVADLLSREILKSHLADIKGSEPFSYGILNYSFSDIEINGYTRPEVGLQINPSGSFSLSFSEASVAATAVVVCKKAAGAVKFRHTTSVILSIYGVSVFVNANIWLSDFGIPVVEASTCSSSMGSIIASFQGDVNSLYNPIARSKKFRRNLHTSLGGMMCGMVTRSINSNGLLGTFNGQPALHDSATLDLRMSSGLMFGSDFIESSHRGRMISDSVYEESPAMFLAPERMLTIGISEATLNSVARVLHNDGFLTRVLSGPEIKDLLSKLKESFHLNDDAQLVISSRSPPVFSINPKGVFLKLEIEGNLMESDKNSSIVAGLKMSASAQLKPLLSYHNLTAAVVAFVPTVKEATPNAGGEFLKDFVVKVSEEIQHQTGWLLKIGLPLPKLKGTLYINDYHKPYNRYMSITCDVIYAP